MKKRIIVVGATSGIGLEVATLFAQKGYDVGIAGRRIERLEELASSTPGIVAYERIDITQKDAPDRLKGLINKLGGMDIYVHSSGIGWQNNLLEMDKEIKTMETNGTGFVRMVTAAYDWFATSGNSGQIACITSIAGTRGLGAAPAYSSTKRMQSHYLECLSQQARMRQLPIRVTDIRPGFVATDLIAGSHYPLQLPGKTVACDIMEAIQKGKEVVTIDWRYRMLVAAWRLIPRWLWIRMKIK